MSDALGPVEALRIIRAILSDRAMSNAERIAAAAIILCADNETGRAWASYRGVRAEFGLSHDAIAGALAAETGKAIGRYLEVAGRGPHGAMKYAALRLPERSRERSALRLPGASAPVCSAQRSGERRQTHPMETDPINSPRENMHGVARGNGKAKKWLTDVTAAELQDDHRLADLYSRAVRAGILEDCEANLVRVFGAAELAIRKATRNPAGFFARVVSRADWSTIAQADEDRAVERIRTLRRADEPAQPAARQVRRVLSRDAEAVMAARKHADRQGGAALDYLRGWTRAQYDAAETELNQYHAARAAS